jgi:hypothetical protein
VSELSKRVTQDVEAQGRLQRLAAECAARLAQGYASGTGAGTIRALAPDLILAWLEGYNARLADEVAGAKAELARAETESDALKSRRR